MGLSHIFCAVTAFHLIAFARQAYLCDAIGMAHHNCRSTKALFFIHIGDSSLHKVSSQLLPGLQTKEDEVTDLWENLCHIMNLVGHYLGWKFENDLLNKPRYLAFFCVAYSFAFSFIFTSCKWLWHASLLS